MGRPRRDDVVTFDVSHDADDGVDDAARTGDGRADGVAAVPRRDRVRRWWRAATRRQRRTATALVAGAAVVLTGGTVAASTLANHVEAERLRTAPGGVLSLDGPLTEVWSADVSSIAAVLPAGGIVTTEGPRVVAREVATGAERWEVTLTGAVECGPRPRLDSVAEWTVPVETVTCVHGRAGNRAVTVLDADGAVVGQRGLAAERYGGRARSVVAAADGALAVTEHDTDLPERLTFATPDEMFSELSQMEVDGGGTRTWLEDALTGERRQTLDLVELPWAHGVDCYTLGEDEVDSSGLGTAGRATLNLGATLGTPTMVGFAGCAADGAATYTGVPLGYRSALATTWPRQSVRQPYPDERFVVPAGEGSSLLADDGEPVLDVPGLRLEVPATDGTAGDGYVAVEGAERVVLLAEDGSERWSAPGESPRVLVRTDDLVVVSGWDELVGYDAADGTERWRLAPDAGPRRYVLSAVTDGVRMTGVLMDVSVEATAELSLFTLDLRTGQEVAPRVRDVATRTVLAVDGHLVVPELPADEVLLGDATTPVVGLRVLAPGEGGA
ncbi:PQQ-binding-like beta-propeller repeat protein [Isoptericola haloaureus]|uniref:PQQ-binding-like beta-propeller repeat protein n=1 Tax=Isoptericola haloaureus TaxID=1542902 RepID=A0ABU7Z7G6_9MICO